MLNQGEEKHENSVCYHILFVLKITAITYKHIYRMVGPFNLHSLNQSTAENPKKENYFRSVRTASEILYTLFLKTKREPLTALLSARDQWRKQHSVPV